MRDGRHLNAKTGLQRRAQVVKAHVFCAGLTQPTSTSHSLIIRSCSHAYAVQPCGFPPDPSSVDEIWYMDSLREGETMTQ